MNDVMNRKRTTARTTSQKEVVQPESAPSVGDTAHPVATSATRSTAHPVATSTTRSATPSGVASFSRGAAPSGAPHSAGDTPQDNTVNNQLRNRDVRVCFSLTLLFIASYVLNTAVFPNVVTVFPIGREISTYCGVAFSIVVAGVAYLKPSLLREGAWTSACLVLFAAGLILLYLGIATGNTLLAAWGSPFGGIGSVWFGVLIGLALITLGPKRSLIVILIAFMLKYATQFGLSAFVQTMPCVVSLLLYFGCTVASYLLIRPEVRLLINSVRRSASPTILDATNPSSFLSFSSPIYVSMFLFNAACGYAFASQTNELPQLASLLSFLPVVAVFFIVVAARARLSADALYQMSTLLVFAGFLSVPLAISGVGGAVGQFTSSTLLYAGSDCFSILTYFLIAAVGARNLSGALSTSASAVAACWLGIGGGALIAQGITLLGMHNVAAVLGVSALITFTFMAYNFIALKHFSFDGAILGVHPVSPLLTRNANETFDATASTNENPDSEETSTIFDLACEEVAQQFGLTHRESDVLCLLARGRTSPVIQEKLFLSHNTVKTHVRHIYAKMNIHSQQELIDIVEGKTTHVDQAN